MASDTVDKAPALMTADQTTYVTLDEDGNTVSIDIHTGEVTKIEFRPEDAPSTLSERYVKILAGDGQLVYVPKGTKASILKQIQGIRYSFPYSPILADNICCLISEGEFITSVCKEENMPSYNQFAAWRRQYPSLDLAYRQAVKDRAEYYLARAVSEVEDASPNRDDVSLAKLRSDIYKYVAKVGDPDSFTEKQKIESDVAITGYVVETGIRRTGDPGFNKDETRDLVEEDIIDVE